MDQFPSSRLEEDLAAVEPLRRDEEDGSIPDVTMRLPTGRRNLYLAAFCANLASVTTGCAMVWSSPSIPKMKAAGLIDDFQASWLTSLLAVGGVVGPFLSYRLIDKIGKRATIILDMYLFILSWALLGLAPVISSNLSTRLGVTVDQISIMYVARFLSGVGVGCSFMVIPLYIAEISDTHVRGSLGSLMSLFLCIGFLIEYCIGPYYSSSVLILASSVPPVLCLVAFMLILPESPLFLLSKQDAEGANKSLQWLRERQDVYLEIVEIQKVLEETRTTSVAPWSQLVLNRRYLKCISYGMALVFFQQLSGINVVMFYCETIFRMSSSDLSSAISTIIVGVVFTLAAVLAPLLTRRYSMKRLLFLSSISCCVFQGIVSGYFYLEQQKMEVKSFFWVPLSSIIFYLITYSIGLGPLPWAVMAEIFSPAIKSKGSAFTAAICWFFSFLLTEFFPLVSTSLGPAVCFAVFSGFCIVSTVYVGLILPDTYGLTMAEIQTLLYGS
ncbi:hypothetical protein M8J77_012612 [Diaphorina citri]|nr:hypothetical protein M8J77_012612 [Diaphorina citri]